MSVRRPSTGRVVAAAALLTGVGLVATFTAPALAAQQPPAAPPTSTAIAGGAHFAVLVPAGAPLTAAEAAITANGGTIGQRWPQLGVVFARSTRADFAAAVRQAPGVESAGATRALNDLGAAAKHARRGPQFQRVPAVGGLPAGKSTAAEPLAANQWNMKLIQADQANAVNPGSRDVLVGVLDSGIDASHPDLAANIDRSASAGCGTEGVPDTSEAAWTDDYGHGTHVAGIVAAARNGVGVAGVAPNVRVASIKVSDADGYIYPEYAICGYVWAAEHQADIATASFSIDPWYLWCDDDPDQKAVSIAIQRAVSYAVGKSVVPVVSLGNQNWDLAHDITDTLSPNNGTPVTRATGNSCKMLPVEASGANGVTSVGAFKDRYYASNYGVGAADLAGPGGDRLFQIPQTPDANGQVLSTVPGGYGYLQGTSMAAPHIAGVLALVKSKYPTVSGQQLFTAAVRKADMLPCPAGGVHDPGGQGAWRAVCEGGATGAGFYGGGLVNALRVVS
ncbi:S8 family peptidase [Kribbella italica]|uniref:Subtilisin family serine protease n=1 Tax=Kribbella italica TaxID=1540520 RepID=A0A7W9J866_9ACTN|nr:S8 family serine peptidase [Kribbella italica]MBB5836935.1 subtilisin family serine protease [Kribbella italica]